MQKLLGSGHMAAGASGSKFTTSAGLRAPPSASRPTLTSRETVSADGAPEDDRETAQQAVAAIKEAVGVLSAEEGGRSGTQVGDGTLSQSQNSQHALKDFHRYLSSADSAPREHCGCDFPSMMHQLEHQQVST